MHTLWSTLLDNKQDRARSKEFENQVECLKRRLEHKEEIEKELLARIRTLEEQVAYWKKACTSKNLFFSNNANLEVAVDPRSDFSH